MVSRLIYGAHLATPTASAPSLRQPFHKVRDLPVPLVRLKLKGRRALSCDADEYVPASTLEPDHPWAALPDRQPKLAAEELFRCRQRRVRRQRGSRLIAHQNLRMCQALKGTACVGTHASTASCLRTSAFAPVPAKRSNGQSSAPRSGQRYSCSGVTCSPKSGPIGMLESRRF